jgi:hypothetical protein
VISLFTYICLKLSPFDQSIICLMVLTCLSCYNTRSIDLTECQSFHPGDISILHSKMTWHHKAGKRLSLNTDFYPFNNMVHLPNMIRLFTTDRPTWGVLHSLNEYKVNLMAFSKLLWSCFFNNLSIIHIFWTGNVPYSMQISRRLLSLFFSKMTSC